MKQQTLIRNKVLALIQNLAIYVSCLSEREEQALIALKDVAVRQRIADYILTELGAEMNAGNTDERFDKNRRAAAKSLGKQRGE